MSFRLTRDAKILKASEYAFIFKGGKRVKGQYWQIIYRKKFADWLLIEIDLNALLEKYLE